MPKSLPLSPQKPLPGMPVRSTIICSFSMNRQVKENLAYAAKRLGITQSALLSQMLATPLAEIRELLEEVPEGAGPESMVRFRGKSRAQIEKKMFLLKQLLADSEG